jgi:hypothetical protein
MGHVAALVGGAEVSAWGSDGRAHAYRPVPRTRQRAALAFLAEHAFNTPAWLTPAGVVGRLGPAASAAVVERQAQVVAELLDGSRLARLAAQGADGAAPPSGAAPGSSSAASGPGPAYPAAAYLADLRRALWEAPAGRAPDANRRALQRVHVERLAALVQPNTGAAPEPLARSDVPALARGELATVGAAARRAAAGAVPGVARAHWADLAARADAALAQRRGT